ncbi:hypothetical protein B7C42_01749 [Nocardia cerradoensis]|uniref:Uncharacterized protein n=2 Tax=Nocardia cerradoensis TaxID=85688 RepID=A0A231HCW9_9NOCA|nr:hypothetical protein [Nocardia cerradoensis]OXR46771.1 hypothetical protein B7C42_01749 [Nocardia cerradoensis]
MADTIVDFLANTILSRSIFGLSLESPSSAFDKIFGADSYVEDMNKHKTTMRRDYGLIETGFTREGPGEWRCFSLIISVHRLRWDITLPQIISSKIHNIPSTIRFSDLEASVANRGEELALSGPQFHDFQNFTAGSGARIAVIAEDFDELLLEGCVWNIQL